MDSRGKLSALAREHLPADLAEKYISLLRPAFGLGPDTTGPVVGQVGGLPNLPDDVDWPILTEGSSTGPLSFIASINLSRLPPGVLDLSLPDSGTLYFFYFDGHLDNTGGWGTDDAPKSGAGVPDGGEAGAPVLYVPSGRPLRERPAPPRLRPLERQNLRVEIIDTDPDYDHPALLTVFDKPDKTSFWHPVFHTASDAFSTARHTERKRFDHQLGGYSLSLQHSPEGQVNMAAAGQPPTMDGTLLAQFEVDCPFTYLWLIRPSHLAATDFTHTRFVEETD